MADVLYLPVKENSRVYGECSARKGAWLVIAEHPPYPGRIALTDALQNTGLHASFLFSDPPLEVKNDQDAFNIASICDRVLKGGRGIVWVRDGNPDLADTLLLSPDSSRLSAMFDTQVSCSLRIKAQNGAELGFDGNAGLIFKKDPPPLEFSNPKNCHFISASVSLCGKSGGVFSFTAELESGWFGSGGLLYCGFDYLFSDSDNTEKAVSLPFWDTPPPRTRMLFSLYPCDVEACGAVFCEKVSFSTHFRSLYGETIFLTSAQSAGFAFKLNKFGASEHTVSPQGAYLASTGTEREIKLPGGLSGTEYFIIPQGGILEFASGYPAYSPYFPQKSFSISDFVTPPPSLLLSDKYRSSWARAAGSYCSQPSDSPLFAGSGNLLLPAEMATTLPSDAPFVPLLPYAAFFEKEPDYFATAEQAAGFEKFILAKTRGDRLLSVPNAGWRQNALAGATAATASGYVAEVDENGGFKKIAVAFSLKKGLAFESPTAPVCAAFRNSGMFSVFANPCNTGAFTGLLAIEDWRFELNIGSGSEYNNYSNILLIKSSRGKIFDPARPEKSLCANLNSWTGRDAFSAPLVDGKPQASQTANLSGWLLNYFKDAYAKNKDPHFALLADVITDENWQGFLALNVELDYKSLPQCLRGLLAGVAGEALKLHHMGSRLTPVKAGANGPVNDGDSPFFGLIYYEAEDFCGSALPPRDTSSPYEYRLLEMKALFENGKVKNFKSLSQFTLGDFLGVKPGLGTLPYNALLLHGALQSSDGASVLTMTSEGGVIPFAGAPFNELTVTGLSMTSTDPDSMSFTFNINGALSFPGPQSGAIDLFSYDSLLFSSYAVKMSKGGFEADLSRLSFDPEHSSLRGASLGKIFGLLPRGAIFGNADNLPSARHYLPLAGDNLKNSAFTTDWAGLEFSVSLGSLGSLAGDSRLEARILLAWDNAGGRYAGIALPGSSLIENVIGLTFGGARLSLNNGKLTLNVSGVAVQLLGMLKLPQSGALTLALCGGDDGLGWFGAYKK